MTLYFFLKFEHAFICFLEIHRWLSNCFFYSVILELASKKDAVVISNDQYRDWLTTRPEFRAVIENR